MQMSPAYVMTQLCGGGCHSPSHSCVATKQAVRQVPVLLSSCGLGTGVCAKTCAMHVLSVGGYCLHLWMLGGTEDLPQ